jgi:hypothetical protein
MRRPASVTMIFIELLQYIAAAYRENILRIASMAGRV